MSVITIITSTNDSLVHRNKIKEPQQYLLLPLLLLLLIR
jgi:hypothetical protein